MKNRNYQIKILPLFEQDLSEIADYIAGRLKNPDAANHLVDVVEKAILERSENPDSFEPYHSAKERQHPYYRIYVKNYIVYYVVIDDVMEVRRILYKKRNEKEHL